RGAHLRIGEVHVLLVDGVEHLLLQLVDEPHRLERVVDLGVRLPAADRGMHALEGDVLRQLREPRPDRRLDRVAVRAAVPEEFDHLDLRRVLRRLGGAQHFDLPGLLRGGAERGDQEGGEQCRRARHEHGMILQGCLPSSVVRMMAAPTPFWDSAALMRFASSRLWYGPRRTRYSVPLSGMLTERTEASNPVNAIFAFRLSASFSSAKAPACSQYTSPLCGLGAAGDEPGFGGSGLADASFAGAGAGFAGAACFSPSFSPGSML